jgi:molybdate transport system substrate-binding protein
MKKTVILLICAIILAACGGDDSDEPTEVTVFAAASLTDAFETLASEFEARNQGVAVRLNFASSSALATQINEGAGADVFASANPQQMQNVADQDGLVGEAQPFAGNRLVVAAHVDSEVNAIEDLTAEGVTLVLVAPETPIRVYTDESIAMLNDSSEFGDDFTERVMANVVSEEATVRAAVLKVALGEADACIVYASDITPDIREDVRAIDIPDEFNVLATYPIAATSDNALATAFIDFVLSADGQAILAEWGFLSAPD